MAVLAAEAGLRLSGMGFGNSPMESDQFLNHVHPKNYTFVQQHPSGELGGFEIEYDAEGRVFRGSRSCAGDAAGSTAAVQGRVDGRFVHRGRAGAIRQVFRRPARVGRRGSAARSETTARARTVRRSIWCSGRATSLPGNPMSCSCCCLATMSAKTSEYLQDSTRDERGFPTAIHGPADGWLFSQLRTLYVARFARMVGLRAQWAWEHYGQEQWTVGGVVEENPEWGGETPALVKEIDRRVRASGSRLIVMAVPSRYRLMGDGKIKVDGDFHQTIKQFTAAERHRVPRSASFRSSGRPKRASSCSSGRTFTLRKLGIVSRPRRWPGSILISSADPARSTDLR